MKRFKLKDEAAQIVTAIMSNPNPPKTAGELLDKLQEYEIERIKILKKLARQK